MSSNDSLEQCVQAFVARDYGACAQQALDTLSTGTSHELLQLLLISLQRLGQTELLDQLGPQVLAATAELPWHHALLALTLGQADPASLYEQAIDEGQRCQVLFYTAIRLLLVGRAEEARQTFEACLALDAPCLEHHLAAVERHSLAEATPAPAADGPQQQIDELNQQVAGLYQQGRYPEAVVVACRACDFARQHLGADHPYFATSLNNLAGLYQSMGSYAQAEPLYRQATEIYRQALGEKHPYFATSLNNRALLYQAMGSYIEAEPLYRQATEIRRQALGAEHPDFASSLNNLALLYKAMGSYAQAEPLLRQATEIFRQALGAEHPDFASSLNNLAALYRAMGSYAQAEPLFRQATEIFRQALGAEHPSFAASLSGLAALYHSMGNYAQAEPLCRQVAEINRKALGEEHPDFAASLNDLALLYQAMGDYAQAEPLCRQATEIRRQALGEQHPHFAASLNDLALLYHSMGNYAQAEPLYLQATEIRRQTLGEDHPHFASSLNNLAALYESMGSYAQAEPLYRQATEIRRQTLGEDHPHFAASLNGLAALTITTDRAAEALHLMRQAASIDDRLIGQVFSIGSESQRTAFVKTTQGNLEAFLSLVWGHLPHLPEAVQAALELVLRRKAIGAEVLAAQRDAVLGGKYPHLQPQLHQWSTLRRQIAQKTWAGPGPEGAPAHQRQLAQWHEQREHLEAELARQVPEMNLEQKLHAADRRAVALALPEGVRLVEFVRFDVCDFKAVPARGERQWQPARYLAFVLTASNPEVRMIDLGAAAAIDELVELFRAGVSELPESRNMVRRHAAPPPLSPEQAGQRLRAAVFDPLLDALGAGRRLLLSPDGNLTRLPFAVLPDANGGLLMDAWQLSYVNCGRDVLRFGAASSGTPAAALVVTDPDFDLAASAAAQPATEENRGRVSRDLPRDRFHFGRLPGTRTEGAAIADLLGVQPWQDSAAVEGRLKRDCRSPHILHLATHGFFLEDQKHDPNQERRDLGLSLGEGRFSGPLPENPLLRSGLALSGANTFLRGGALPEEAEDGLLTAEDVSGLDLLATELVVLSACETGLGEVRTGEGVFGLQRAFTLAGAKTLVMSLWSVPDDATRELMEDFYRRILAGEGRADALRNAQLALRRKHPDPYFWGAFLCQGDPAPLGQTVSSSAVHQ